MKFSHDQAGFTLIETLVTLVIGVVIGSLLLVIMVNTGGLFYRESSRVGQGLSANDALSKISETIKESSGVVATYTSGSTTYTTSSTQLILKLASIDANGNILTNTFDYFIFFSDQTKLRFKTFPDNGSSRKPMDQIFSTSLNSLNFQYLDINKNEVTPISAVRVKFTLILKQKAGSGYEINTATAEANLRND